MYCSTIPCAGTVPAPCLVVPLRPTAAGPHCRSCFVPHPAHERYTTIHTHVTEKEQDTNVDIHTRTLTLRQGLRKNCSCNTCGGPCQEGSPSVSAPHLVIPPFDVSINLLLVDTIQHTCVMCEHLLLHTIYLLVFFVFHIPERFLSGIRSRSCALGLCSPSTAVHS